MKNLLNRNGESLLEVMMAIAVIFLAIISAFKVLSMSFVQKEMTEARMIGINLAREGIEAVHYMRDYNWLYYGSNQRICWNHLEDNDEDGQVFIGGTKDDPECSENATNGFPDHQIATEDGASPGQMEYILNQDDTHWFFTRNKEDNTKIANGDWDALLVNEIGINADGSKIAIPNVVAESYRLCRDTSGVRYISCLSPDADINSRTQFLRSVKIEYLNGDPTDTNDANTNGLSDGQESNLYQVTVAVKWMEQGHIQDVEILSILSDFYKRTPLDKEN